MVLQTVPVKPWGQCAGQKGKAGLRVVKPYGTTKTEPGEDGALRRSIHPNSFRHEAKDVADFAESNPKLVLSQWISMIDKVITKPVEGSVPSLNQYNLREEIGTAAWSIIVDRDLLSAIPKRLKRLEREWWSRIHPYGREIEPTGALDFSTTVAIISNS